MKKKMLFVAAVIFSSQGFAQQDSLRALNEVVVTATKFPAKQSETGKVLNVISRAQLQQSSGKTVADVLNHIGGLSIVGANNNLGTNQSVYLQGGTSSNTLLMLDGVPLNDASGINAEFDLSTFLVDQIERIEILKGAQSTLYGSDAVAGVINIISRKKASGKDLVQFTAAAGSYDTYRANISISGTDDNVLDYFAGYSKIISKGFSSAYDSTGVNNFEKDGYNQDAFQASIGYTPNAKFKARAYTRMNFNRADIDAGAFADDADYTFSTLNMNWGTSLQYSFKKGTLFAHYNLNWYDRRFNDGSTSIGGFSTTQKGNYTGKSHFAELYTTIKWNDQIRLLSGVDYRQNSTDQSYNSTSIYGPFETKPLAADTANTRQISAYASLFIKLGKGFQTEIGGRINHHSIYGTNATYSFNPFVQVNKQLKIFGNISSGYRVPSLYQLYSEYGNKLLKPEQSVNVQAGVQYQTNTFNARVLGFNRAIKDVMTFYTDPNTYNSFYINDDRQNDYGFEAELSVQPTNKLSITANYMFVDGLLKTKDAMGKDTSYFNLYRRPKHTLNLHLSYQITPVFLITSTLRTVSNFYEPKYADAPYTMKGYYTWDVYCEYRLKQRFKLFADFQNITNVKYFDLRGFNSRRFNVNAGVTIQL
ncbi:MAG: TonB-dependent receptor plug domain-containing protein [Ferruginibacter sp.]